MARLIEAGAGPEQILLATFTNKAARSMLARVNHLVARDTGRLWGGTFHHIAHLILRTNGHLLGYERNFTIMDSRGRPPAHEHVHVRSADRPKADKFPKGDILRDILSLAVNTECSPENIVFSRYSFFHHRMEEIQDVSCDTSREKSP